MKFPTMSLHSDTVEIRPTTCGVGVRITGRTRLAGDVGSDNLKYRLCQMIRAPFKEIRPVADTLPSHRDSGNVVGDRGHFQQRCGIGGTGSGSPFAPVVKAVTV